MIMLVHILDYLATRSMQKKQYYASDMALYIHSDTSYLSQSKAKSRSEESCLMEIKPKVSVPIKMDCNIHVSYGILRSVVCSAAEAELKVICLNLKKDKILYLALEELGQP